MVLVYAESQDGKFKKAALEAVAYGNATAKVIGTECAAVVIGNADGAAALGQYGASAVHHICLLYTSPSPRDGLLYRMPSSA